MAGLTLKQRMFCDEYIISGNIYQSAVKAGYSKAYAKGNASKLMENVSIKSYIADRMAELDSQKIAKQDEVLAYLTSIMRGLETEQTLRGMGDGYQEIDAIEVSAKDRIKAAELLGKRYAMWTEKQEVTGDIAVTFIDDIGSELDDG